MRPDPGDNLDIAKFLEAIDTTYSGALSTSTVAEAVRSADNTETNLHTINEAAKLMRQLAQTPDPVFVRLITEHVEMYKDFFLRCATHMDYYGLYLQSNLDALNLWLKSQETPEVEG